MTTAKFPTDRPAFLARKTEELKFTLTPRQIEVAEAAEEHLTAAIDKIHRALKSIKDRKLQSVGADCLLASDECKSAFEALESLERRAK